MAQKQPNTLPVAGERPDPPPLPPHKNTTTITPHKPQEIEQAQALARRAHRNTRTTVTIVWCVVDEDTGEVLQVVENTAVVGATAFIPDK